MVSTQLYHTQYLVERKLPILLFGLYYSNTRIPLLRRRQIRLHGARHSRLVLTRGDLDAPARLRLHKAMRASSVQTRELSCRLCQFRLCRCCGVRKPGRRAAPARCGHRAASARSKPPSTTPSGLANFAKSLAPWPIMSGNTRSAIRRLSVYSAAPVTRPRR